LQVPIITDFLNPRLEWQHLIVAGHDGDSAELEPLGEVHGANAHAARLDFHAVVEHTAREFGETDCRSGSRHLLRRANEHADLVRL
jgi:hypothetical protein